METEIMLTQKKDLSGITFLFAFYVILTSSFSANPVNESQASLEAYDSIAILDSAAFAAFYTNTPEKSNPFFAEDAEFFHDNGGFIKSREAFSELVKKDFCREQKECTVRRELVKASMKVYPLNENGVTYGALQTGEQRFYETDKRRMERLAGIGKFTHIWINKEGKWKILRVISYDRRVVR